jgi:hypothetical protein
MRVTILRRYDMNGAFTHDIDIKLGVVIPDENSMYRFAGVYKLTPLDIILCTKCRKLTEHKGKFDVGCEHCD